MNKMYFIFYTFFAIAGKWCAITQFIFRISIVLYDDRNMRKEIFHIRISGENSYTFY